MNWLKSLAATIGLAIAFLMAVIFVSQQDQQGVSLSFLTWETPQLKMYWWLLVAFAIGLTFGLVNAGWMNLKRRVEARSLRRELKRVNAELDQLRTTAVQD